MREISVFDAKPGMILGKPVMRDASLVLVGEGAELTDDHIWRFENMGLETIWIKEDDGGGDVKLAAVYEKRLPELDRLFRRQDDPYMLDLKAKLSARGAAVIAAAKAAEQAKAEKVAKDKADKAAKKGG